MAEVVVVGAGIGGLAAAARLATAGHRVSVYEQAAGPGGKVATYRRDGFAFDTGPSLLTLPAVYRDLFLKTATTKRGASLEDNIELRALDPAFGYRWADGSGAVLPGSNTQRVAVALGDALGGSAADDWNRFSRRAAQTWSVTRGPFLESPLDGPRDLLRKLHRVRDLRSVAPWRTLRGLARRSFADDRLVTLLDRYATYAGSDPRRAPAALSVIPYVEQTFGAWHVGGGLGGLADAVYRRCVERGVHFEFGADVGDVLTEGGRVCGVRLTDGRRVAADIVVANADASHVYQDLVTDPRARGPLASLGRATPSLSGFVLLLALRGRSAGMEHHTVLFPHEYDAEFDAVFGPEPTPVPDPAVYICAPDDPAMRPDDGHESWFVLVNAPRHQPAGTTEGAPGAGGTARGAAVGVDWDASGVATAYADHVLAVMARRGVDVRDRVVWRELRTPADLERQARAPGGSIYGTSSNGLRSAFLRPANRSPVPGLFLVGGSAHPGGGLPLVALSAAIVATAIGPP